MPAFNGRAVYTSPIDHKNVNRVFPGKKDGTVSERIAYTLTNLVLSKSDYYIDLHGGEFNERIVDYIYYCSGSPESDLCKKSLEMALAMDNKYLIPYEYLLLPDSVQSEYSEQEAFRQGAASITLEWGDLGVVKQEEIESAIKGIRNVMKLVGMLEGTPVINSNPVYLVNTTFVNSNYDGIVYTFVDRAQYITKGTLIGYTTDYWGNILEEYHAPFTGIVVAVKATPAINKGEDVFQIAEPVDEYKE
jgi:predicted deacylase